MIQVTSRALALRCKGHANDVKALQKFCSVLRAEGELLSKISENFKKRRGAFGTRPTKCPRSRNMVLGINACFPKKFQRFKMTFLIMYT